jgi:hypothetical protein
MGARALRGSDAHTTTSSASWGVGPGPSLRFSLLVSLLVVPLVLLALALGSRGARQEARENHPVGHGSTQDVHIKTSAGQIVVELFATTGPEARKRTTDDIAISTFFGAICQAGFYDEGQNYFDQGEKGLHLCGGPDKQLGEDRLIQMFGRDQARQGPSSHDPRKRGDFGLLVEDRFEGYSVYEPGFHSGRFMIVLSDDLDLKDAATQIVELRFILEEMSKDKALNYRRRQYGLPEISIASSMYKYSEAEHKQIQERIEGLSLLPQRTHVRPARSVPKFVRLGRVTEGLDVADTIAGQLRYDDNHGSVMIRSSSRVAFEFE